MKVKKILSAVLFLGLAALTFYVVFKNQDIGELLRAIGQMHKGYLLLAAATAVFFVSAEGILIWYLLRAIGDKARLVSCLKYSFTGFFYSGITPSATGGQPMQLYYMNKDGHKLADSSVVLMSVATAYKLVLVLMGVGISIFWWKDLCLYLGEFLPIYFLGLFLNALLVVILLAIMLNGQGMEKFIKGAERLFVRMHLLKPSEKRAESIHTLVGQYQETVSFLKSHVRVIAFLVGFTFVQRCSVFILTYFVYKGMGLSGTGAFTIMALQAVVYIAVDMLPLPGSQGITELMYAAVFGSVFVGGSLTISMCVSRGLNFYMLLLISALVAAYCWWSAGRRKGGEKNADTIRLTLPVEEYLAQVWEYRQECLDAGSHMDGCGPLRQAESPAEWLANVNSYMDPATIPEGKVQATQFLAVRESDNKVVAMIQVRHYFNEYLEKYAGNIGYSTRPSERRKGYATKMLSLTLPFCREIGLDKVLIACEPNNAASRRTILLNGGEYECTVHEPGADIDLERYWIVF